ncbi:hypothetical protein A9306_10130 [Moraxella atlantae]|uniref:Uncharacterized protein n=1 Tax=Faucicola atlantae TaxID=34059 RepID=A0A1B8QAF7_9GAMM|nr:hypothetical protein A9306_10130 [Moraxella atlantae]
MDDGVNVEVVRDNKAFLSFGFGELLGWVICFVFKSLSSESLSINRFIRRQFGSLVIAKIG